MYNRKLIGAAAFILCAASSVACGGSGESKSAAETAPSKEMDQSSQGGEGAPDGTSSADDKQGSTHTMPDGTSMEDEEMGHQ